jgi:hypothetical protein
VNREKQGHEDVQAHANKRHNSSNVEQTIILRHIGARIGLAL